MIKVQLFSRPGCHLCDETKKMLSDLKVNYPIDIDEINIDTDPVKFKNYLLEIPVIKVGVYTLKAPIDRMGLEVAIRSAVANDEDTKKLTAQKIPSKLDQFAKLASEHWLMIVNLFFIGYLGLAFLAPILMHLGFENLANIIYKVYGFFCHQLAFRSFFLFGDQSVYPRELAHVDELVTFGAATGLNEMDLLGARKYLGDELLGYKVAFCQRDVAIYSGIILFGLIFSLLKSKVKALPFYGWLILAFLPIAFDGLSQLITQIPLKFIAANLPIRESSPFLRTLTGFLFGFGTAWMGFPVIDESMKE